jgi:hypothetical protein
MQRGTKGTYRSFRSHLPALAGSLLVRRGHCHSRLHEMVNSCTGRDTVLEIHHSFHNLRRAQVDSLAREHRRSRLEVY